MHARINELETQIKEKDQAIEADKHQYENKITDLQKQVSLNSLSLQEQQFISKNLQRQLNDKTSQLQLKTNELNQALEDIE